MKVLTQDDVRREMTLLLENAEGSVLAVGLEDFGRGPGLGSVRVKVVNSRGDIVVPGHRYHFDVRRRDTLDLERLYEEPAEIPACCWALLTVEPSQVEPCS